VAAAPRTSRLALVVVLLTCCAALLLGHANKARCTGPTFDGDGRSTAFVARQDAEVCYSDVQGLWLGREVDQHVFPYVHGALSDDGTLVGGSLEYPVLTGLLIWAAALGARTDAGFLLATALLLAPFGLLTAWLLARMTRWRALLFTATPPLVLYAVQNWELPVVASSVLAVWLVSCWRVPLRRRALVASVVLGVGFCLKLYPGAFVLPLALLVLTGGVGGHELPEHVRRFDVRGALAVVGAAGATVVAVNLPFALLGPAGWWASFRFQGLRKADLSTNSIWYWGLRPVVDHSGSSSGSDTYQRVVTVASPSLVLLAFALAVALGWRRYRREGTYPWLAVSAAMLCGFLLLHQVHSPQYTLWLLPFLVLLRVRWPLVVGYLVCDLAMEVGIFRYFELGLREQLRPGATALVPGSGAGLLDQLTPAAVLLGVWGRAALLVVLFVVFLRTTPVGPVEPAPTRPPG
jgi:uncharacterized membrane protein